MLHAWERYGLEQATQEFIAKYDTKDRGGFARTIRFEKVVKGKIDYMAMVRGEADPLVRRYLSWFAELEPAYTLPPTPSQGANHVVRIHDAIWVLECEESNSQGSGFMLEGYGLVTCAHVLGPATHAFRADDPTRLYPVTVQHSVEALDVALLTIDVADPYALRKGSTTSIAIGSKVTIAGFPNYRLGDSGWVSSGAVAAFRRVSTVRRILVDTPIVAGCSGGPVLDSRNRVIGIAVTGADRIENADNTENHGVIPIEALDLAIANDLHSAQ
jgi:S1-C subfamily serine protease